MTSNVPSTYRLRTSFRCIFPLVVRGMRPRRTKTTSASGRPRARPTSILISRAIASSWSASSVAGLDHEDRLLAGGAARHRERGGAHQTAAPGHAVGETLDLVRHEIVAADDEHVLDAAGEVELPAWRKPRSPV